MSGSRRRRKLVWGWILMGLSVLFVAGQVRAFVEGSSVFSDSAETDVPAEADFLQTVSGALQVGPDTDVGVVSVDDASDVRVRIAFPKVESLGGFGMATSVTATAGPVLSDSLGEVAPVEDHEWPESIAGFEEQFENQAKSNPYGPGVVVEIVDVGELVGESDDLGVSVDYDYPVLAEDVGETIGELLSDSYEVKSETRSRDVTLYFLAEQDANLLRNQRDVPFAILSLVLAIGSPIAGVWLLLSARREHA